MAVVIQCVARLATRGAGSGSTGVMLVVCCRGVVTEITAGAALMFPQTKTHLPIQPDPSTPTKPKSDTNLKLLDKGELSPLIFLINNIEALLF